MMQIDLTVPRGEFTLSAQFAASTPGITAVFGRSGSGKSTLVAALAGLLPNVQGHIRFAEQTWLDSSRKICVPAEERRIGCVFQQPRLFPHLNVQGNLDYAAHRARRHRQFISAAEVIHLLGLTDLLPRRVQSLSGGEQSRVALGRALLSQPQLLILDEPLAHLDGARREEILPYLEELRDRYALTMVYVSHRYEEVLRLAGHVVLLESGQLLASMTPAELSLDPRLRDISDGDYSGAVLEGTVIDVKPLAGLVTLSLGSQRLVIPAEGLPVGHHARVFIPARDVLLATHAPIGLSVRNQLLGTITSLSDDGIGGCHVQVHVEGLPILARITATAVNELSLAPGQPIYVLIKAEALRGYTYARA